MKTICFLCDKAMQTRNENIFVTVDWIFKDILEKNNVKYDKAIPRVVYICEQCWKSLKEGPQGEDYWIFDKNI